MSYNGSVNYKPVYSDVMDETGADYTEWSKPERKTPIQYANAYIWNLESWFDNPVCETAKETQMYRTVFWTLWQKEGAGLFETMALEHVYNQNLFFHL